ncbi:MAG: tetratricopeptide repeat protein [Verrucomicrobiota bacterium]
MSSSIDRALTLLSISRFKEAQEAAQEALASDPSSIQAYLVIAQAALQLDKLDEALNAANQAIGLAPELAPCFQVRARIQLARKKYKAAVEDCQQALEIDPHSASTFGVLAWCFIGQSDWKKALEAAEQGLEEDPEDTICQNARARSLMFLKQTDQAFQSIDSMLARDPENPVTHTLAGWAKLQAKQHDEALKHFSEALRQDPNLGYAREGLITAMKAKNPIYGALLSYSFFMAGLKPGTQFAVLIGGFIAYQVIVRSLAASGYPLLAAIVVAIWMILVVLTWAGDAIFNMLLLFHPFGRMVLSTSQKWISAGVAAVVAAGLGVMFASFFAVPNLLFTGLGLMLVCLPLAFALRLEGRSQMISLGIAGACTAALLGSAIMMLSGSTSENAENLQRLALYALIAFSWIGPSALKRI